MAQRVDYDKIMARKEKSIEKAMDKKQESIEFQSTRRDAIEMVKLEMLVHPNYTRSTLQQSIIDWMNFLFAMREEDQGAEPISEVQTAAEAVEAVKETFPGAKEVQTKTIKNPEEKLTAPQKSMIEKLFKESGVKDSLQQAATAKMLLKLKNLTSLDDLNKGQASGLISQLIAKKKES